MPGKPAIEFMTQKFGEGRAEQVVRCVCVRVDVCVRVSQSFVVLFCDQIAMIKTFGRTVGVNFTFAGVFLCPFLVLRVFSLQAVLVTA